MFHWNVLVVLLVWYCVTCGSCGAVVEVTGRHLLIPDPLNASLTAVAFDFSGVALNVTVEQTMVVAVDVALTVSCFITPEGVWSNTSRNPNRFITFVDGAEVPNHYIDTNSSQCDSIVWYRAMTSRVPMPKPFQFSIFKITEPDWNARHADTPNYVLFHAFSVKLFGVDGRQEEAVYRHEPRSLERDQTSISRLRIEFIGDSITCGYCNMCKQMPPGAQNNYAMENFALSWPTLACRRLNAVCHTEAWSGYGMYQNYGYEVSNITMPHVARRAVATIAHDSTLFGVSNEWYNADGKAPLTFIPDAVVINLGTNDFAHPGANVTAFTIAFENAYVEFATSLLKAYAGTIKGMFLACGPMTTSYCDAVFNVISTLRATTSTVKILFLNQTMVLDGHNSCCGHPSAATDEVLAEVTANFISSNL